MWRMPRKAPRQARAHAAVSVAGLHQRFFGMGNPDLRKAGDVIFKQTGSGLTVEPDGRERQSTAAAYYQQSREGRVPSQTVGQRQHAWCLEADLLDERIVWLRYGLPYGGQDFYRFDHYRSTNYLTYWRSQLGRSLRRLGTPSNNVLEKPTRCSTNRAADRRAIPVSRAVAATISGADELRSQVAAGRQAA